MPGSITGYVDIRVSSNQHIVYISLVLCSLYGCFMFSGCVGVDVIFSFMSGLISLKCQHLFLM